MKAILVATTFILASTGLARADGIVGNWLRPSTGTVLKISACGGSFCVTPTTGDHKGGDAGKFTASGGGKYAGTLNDLAAGKSYTGKASLNGDVLAMSGCVMGGLICKTENWQRQ